MESEPTTGAVRVTSREIRVPRFFTEKRVTLDLSEEAARALHAITARVRGSESRSPRKHAQEIYKGLKDALEQEPFGTAEYDCLRDDPFYSNIAFDDYPEE